MALTTSNKVAKKSSYQTAIKATSIYLRRAHPLQAEQQHTKNTRTDTPAMLLNKINKITVRLY